MVCARVSWFASAKASYAWLSLSGCCERPKPNGFSRHSASERRAGQVTPMFCMRATYSEHAPGPGNLARSREEASVASSALRYRPTGGPVARNKRPARNEYRRDPSGTIPVRPLNSDEVVRAALDLLDEVGP